MHLWGTGELRTAKRLKQHLAHSQAPDHWSFVQAIELWPERSKRGCVCVRLQKYCKVGLRRREKRKEKQSRLKHTRTRVAVQRSNYAGHISTFNNQHSTGLQSKSDGETQRQQQSQNQERRKDARLYAGEREKEDARIVLFSLRRQRPRSRP